MKGFLPFLSLIYQAGCQLKNFLYKIHLFKPKKAPLSVISIGNIAFGGSEKTPVAMAVISKLLDHSHKPALVTRGYRGKWEKDGGILSDGKELLGNWTDSGDEAYMVALNFPQAGVFVGKNRIDSCRKAYRLGFDVAILDDGFQHRKLSRDCDIVLHNPEKRLPLREPVSSLKRAHVLLLKRNSSSEVNRMHFKAYPGVITYFYSVECQGFYRLDAQTQIQPEVLKTKKILAFCGIARPDRFLTLLHTAGIKPCSFQTFADHHAYPPLTQKKLLATFRALKADVFLTTEKDAVKIKNLAMFRDNPAYFLKLGVKIQDTFADQIPQLLGMKKPNAKKEVILS
jgi:tetraacyldisaccharide 4'-kinase